MSAEPKKFRHVYNVWQRNPGGKKRMFLARWGAVGDMITTASCLPLLKEQGWHVTLGTTPWGEQILRHDPNIDEFWLQDRDQVPQSELQSYLLSLDERFDRILSLSESMEGTLLAMPGRQFWQWGAGARQRIFGKLSYLGFLHDVVGVPHRFNPRFYPTADETIEAVAFKASLKAPHVVYWPLQGSSWHKLYVHTNAVVLWLLQRTNAHVVLVSDGNHGKQLQDNIINGVRTHGGDVSRISGMAGKWSIRQSLTFAQVADIVVGPETGVMWAAGMEDLPKVVMLTHSSPENWAGLKRTKLLPSRGCPFSPCHALQYDGAEMCPKDEETGGAACSAALQPIEVFEAIIQGLGMKRYKVSSPDQIPTRVAS